MAIGWHEKVPDTFSRAAALALALMLAVVVAAAGIRLGAVGLRPVHRAAATLEMLVVLWLAWRHWRRPAVLAALALTAVLSVAGIAGGPQPAPAIAAVNLLGGLALTAVFAWIVGGGRRLPWWIGALLAVQLALGARLAIVDRWAPALPAHALLALPLAAALAWLGLARVGGAAGKALFALAMLAPLAGFTALQYDGSAAAALAHAAAAALLLAAAFAFGRGA